MTDREMIRELADILLITIGLGIGFDRSMLIERTESILRVFEDEQ